MDLASFSQEVRALQSLTDSSISYQRRMALLGRLTEGHFSTDVTRSAFKLVRRYSNTGELPEWDDLVEDPKLAEDAKDTLRDEDFKPIVAKAHRRLVETLSKYKKRRDLKDIAAAIANGLKEDESEEFDEDTLRQQAAGMLADVGAAAAQTRIYGIGKGQHKSGIKFAQKVFESPAEQLYKTGFADYDSINGGFPTSGVILLAATTSGGKSALSMNLGYDIALLNGIDVQRVTLEMTAEQETKRMASMLSGVEFNKIKQGTLSKAEQRKILKVMEDCDNKLCAAGGSYSYLSPERGMDADDVMYLASSTGAHISIVDYVGLLNGIDAGNQAACLSEVVRKFKVHASITGKLYILLVQLDSESGKVRYSRAMVEHSDVLITWAYVDAEVRALKSLPLNVEKARDGELFSFDVPEAFAAMAVGSRAARFMAKSGTEARASIGKKDGGGFAGTKERTIV